MLVILGGQKLSFDRKKNYKGTHHVGEKMSFIKTRNSSWADDVDPAIFTFPDRKNGLMDLQKNNAIQWNET